MASHMLKQPLPPHRTWSILRHTYFHPLLVCDGFIRFVMDFGARQLLCQNEYFSDSATPGLENMT